MLTTPVTLDQLLSYKTMNAELLPELLEFYNNNKNKFVKKQQQTPWRKIEVVHEDNWLVAKKFNQSDDDKLYSQYRSILNKLSESNFNDLAKELTSLEINRQEHLIKLAELIFNKAIIEPKFSIMYAKLSKELASYCIKENDKVSYFRELLINRCQLMFNDCISYEPDVPNKTVITKEMAIGCMTFIGELYNHELLTNTIINSCFLHLLVRAEQKKVYITDCIFSLMKITGNNFNIKCKNEIKIVFEKIDKLIKSTKLPMRDICILSNLMDIKAQSKWN